jgi:hypothetical protein
MVKKSENARQARFRARKEAAGMKRVTLWVPAWELESARADGLVPVIVYVTPSGARSRAGVGNYLPRPSVTAYA